MKGLRTIAIISLLSSIPLGAMAADEKPARVFEPPLKEFRLSNGTVFRDVSLVRYEREKVVLKTSAGQTSLAYSYFPEPMRSRMIAERDEALAVKAESEKAARIVAGKKAEAEQAQQAAREALRARIEDAISRKRIMEGMTESDAIRSWGQPDKRNTSSTRHLDQWIWGRPDGVYYVYFTDGILQSWQYREPVFRR